MGGTTRPARWPEGDGMANSDMSMGKMKSACMHYMKSQKAMMMK